MNLRDNKDKKERKENKIERMVMLGKSAWESFKLYLFNDDMRAYRLFFNSFLSFYEDGEKEEILGKVDGVSLGYKNLKKKYPAVAKRIAKELKDEGVNLKAMEFEFDKMIDNDIEL